MTPLVIYHDNCADGFTSAWIIHKALPDAEFFGAKHGEPPPDVAGRTVILADFCYPASILKEMSKTAASIIVLDHHKTAMESLFPDGVGLVPENDWIARLGPSILKADNPLGLVLGWSRVMETASGTMLPTANTFALFLMDKSGAGLAWAFFNPGVPAPWFVEAVQDRDLWKFEVEGSRELNSVLFSYEYTFENWDKVFALPKEDVIREGEVIDRKHMKDVRELVEKCTRRINLQGFDVPLINVPYTMSSDAGAILAQGEPFAVCYFDTAETREFGLRSADDGEDVGAIAGEFGGGGHAHASGFRVSRDHPLAQI